MTYIFGNWKMYLNHKEAIALAQALKAVPVRNDATVVVFPSMLSFAKVTELLGDTDISIGAQYTQPVSAGAYTGAVNAEMVKEAGGTYVLVGHSERRHIFGDNEAAVHNQFVSALEAGLVPVLCIGETQEDIEAGKREYRLKKQLMTALKDVSLAGTFIVAYEPVWAIGSGNPCLPDDADDVHGFIRSELKQYTDQTVPLLYGGSVQADSMLSYLEKDMIDGVLVGSASVKDTEFSRMITS